MSYKYFKNTSCKYFPCHNIDNKQKFNCLFCFCPLYLTKNCGGNYIILKNGVKNCENCLIPHLNYDYIIDKIKENNVIINKNYKKIDDEKNENNK